MAMFEGGCDTIPFIDNEKEKKQYKTNIDNILTACIKAIDFFDKQTPFSLKKKQYFSVAKKNLKKFQKENNTNEQISTYHFINDFHLNFKNINTNGFNYKEKEAIEALNSLISKAKNSLISNYENFTKNSYSFQEKPSGRFFLFE